MVMSMCPTPLKLASVQSSTALVATSDEMTTGFRLQGSNGAGSQA